MSGFLTNPLLETRAPTGWQGCPLDAKGRFQNLNHPFWPEFSKLWRWQTTANPQKKEKKLDKLETQWGAVAMSEAFSLRVVQLAKWVPENQPNIWPLIYDTDFHL